MFFPFRLALAMSFVLFSVFLLPATSTAGPNAGGVLILHDVDYWSCTQCDPCDFPLPDSCEDVDSREDSFETVLLHVIAGFPAGASPRVADVAFGLDYDDHEVFLSAYSNCGPTEWFGDPEWPAPGSGVEIRFSNPAESLNTALMFVAAYNYYGNPRSLDLIEHPDLGAVFLDDSDPPVVDLIADLGSFGFAQDGYVPCVDDLNQGACCRADGSCDLTDVSRCFASGGAYLGDDTSCDPDPCSATRACCATDGSCSLTTATDCSVSGGVFDSSATACDPNPCREPFGGCCLDVGLCLLATETTCFGTYGAFNPTYFGDGTGCDDSCLGACCLTDGSCTLAYEFVCDGDFLGSMSLCEPNPCAGAFGACCDPLGTCEITLEAECFSIFLGAGTTCSPDPCPEEIGACCSATGNCTIETAEDCTSPNHFFYPGEFCEPLPCRGPCCLPDETCLIRIVGECEDLFLGQGEECDPNPCPSDVGACCSDRGRCTISSSDECTGNDETFLPDVGCSPDPCKGACCLVNGSCEIGSYPNRCDSEGFFLGFGTVCDGSCPQPLGACCIDDFGNCRILPEGDCTAAGGFYFGDSQSCDPYNLCFTACCIGDQCSVQTLFGCENDGGVSLEYGIGCDPAPCVAGACCIPGFGCVELLPADCEAQGGTHLGDTDCAAAGCADGGINGGGTLIVHADPGVVYSQGSTYCEAPAIVECDQATTETFVSDTQVLHVLAAFSPASSPRMAGITFGVSQGEDVFVEGWGSCADFEVGSSGWPLESGSGVNLAWNEARTELLVPVYWFAARGSVDQAGEFSLVPHPTQGAFFFDDSVPSLADPITELGSFGFFTSGSAPCPVPVPGSGACCLGSETCEVRLPQDCTESGGIFQGTGISCEPNPCAPVGTPDDLPIPTRITLASPYPNPTVGSVLIRLGLPESASVDLRWYSVDGTQVGPTESRILAAGTHSLEFQLGSRDGFASGVYFLEATVGQSRMRQRVVLAR